MMDSSFEDFHLDHRLLKAITDLSWGAPTDIQTGVIPHILEKKNLIISARTGSGKTAAYLIPTIQNLLISKPSEAVQRVSVLILCPSKELCSQSKINLTMLTKTLDLSCVDLSSQKKHEILKPLLLQRPDFVIGTPSQAIKFINEGLLDLKNLKALVIDEADLMGGFGYRDDLEKLNGFINLTQCQFLLLSATMGDDVIDLKTLFKVRWFRLQLNNSEMLPSADQLTQFVKRCEEEEKYYILVGMLKLGLIKGKTIIFANNVNKCCRLRMVFESFNIGCALLNAELPVASRNHIVQEFNIGRYDLLLASDEDNLVDNSVRDLKMKKTKKNVDRKDEEFQISRGIDFNQVSNVINVDCPNSVNSYVHRVGRTARVHQKGQALTFVSMKDAEKFEVIDQALMKDNNGVTVFKPYKCSKTIYEGFVYRISEILGKCTKAAVRQARLLDIHREIQNSETLQAYFNENQAEMKVLHKNKPVVGQKAKYLQNVPSYMIPEVLRDKIKKNKSKRQQSRSKGDHAKTLKKKKKSDNPLFSFKKAKK